MQTTRRIHWIHAIVGVLVGGPIGGLIEHTVRVLASEYFPGKLVTSPTQLGILFGAGAGALIGLTVGPHGIRGPKVGIISGGLIGIAVGAIAGAVLYPWVMALCVLSINADAVEEYRRNAHTGMRIAIPIGILIGSALGYSISLLRGSSSERRS